VGGAKFECNGEILKEKASGRSLVKNEKCFSRYVLISKILTIILYIFKLLIITFFKGQVIGNKVLFFFKLFWPPKTTSFSFQ